VTDRRYNSAYVKLNVSKVGDACEIIRALLPDDRRWHAVKPIFDVCAERDIGERTVQRAKARLPIAHRHLATFPASVEWCWLPIPRSDTNDTSDTSDTSDIGDTNDTNDTNDTSDIGDTNDTNDIGDTSDIGTDVEEGPALAVDHRARVLDAVAHGELPAGGPSEMAARDQQMDAAYWERWSEQAAERIREQTRAQACQCRDGGQPGADRRCQRCGYPS
jgi:hypothetical protein